MCDVNPMEMMLMMMLLHELMVLFLLLLLLLVSFRSTCCCSCWCGERNSDHNDEYMFCRCVAAITIIPRLLFLLAFGREGIQTPMMYL